MNVYFCFNSEIIIIILFQTRMDIILVISDERSFIIVLKKLFVLKNYIVKQHSYR